MRFIHTADWQIGKVFKRFGAKEQSLQQARLAAIEAIGRLAVKEGVAHVLVAGDIYDSEVPSRVTLLAPIERMRSYATARWHLLPGNHDPRRPEGVWDRLAAAGLPSNIHLCLEPRPVDLDRHAVLLPAPLVRKSESKDLTAWMDGAPSREGALRIGLAHGSVAGFDGEASNVIDPSRPAKAGLDYLALGDWHRTIEINPRVWYSGTPEPDRAQSQETGTVLLVDIRGRGEKPMVREVPVGTYQWLTHGLTLADGSDLADLETQIRALPSPTLTILRLVIEGALSLSEWADLSGRLERLHALFFHLDADLDGLRPRPTEADLESIDFDGVLRRAADDLKSRSEDRSLSEADQSLARDALAELYLMATRNAEAP